MNRVRSSATANVVCFLGFHVIFSRRLHKLNGHGPTDFQSNEACGPFFSVEQNDVAAVCNNFSRKSEMELLMENET